MMKLVEAHARLINKRLSTNTNTLDIYQNDEIIDYDIAFSYTYKIDDDTVIEDDSIRYEASSQAKKLWDEYPHDECPVKKVVSLELSSDDSMLFIRSYELDELEREQLMDYVKLEFGMFEGEEFEVGESCEQTSQYSSSQQQWYPDEKSSCIIVATIDINSLHWVD